MNIDLSQALNELTDEWQQLAKKTQAIELEKKLQQEVPKKDVSEKKIKV